MYSLPHSPPLVDGMNNQQIAMLQQNLALMTSQLTMLMESKQKKKKKKEKRKSLSSASTSFPPALAAPKPRSKPSAPSKPRNRKSSSSATAKKKTAAPVDSDAEIARMADHEIPEVTQDQKVFLTSGIEKLEPTDLGTVINLIKEGMPGLQVRFLLIKLNCAK